MHSTLCAAAASPRPRTDDWGMTAEDFEIEQDAHLREMGERTRRAEKEAERAILNLAECTVQHNKMLFITGIIATVALMLATIVGYLVYGH